MTIGEILKNMRLRHKRTLKEQSEILGVSVNSVYRWEHDLALPRKTALKKMAHSYGMTVERLLAGSMGESPWVSDNTVYDSEIIEQQLLSMFRKLSIPEKYRILGYMERACTEEVEEQAESVIILRSSSTE